MTASSAGAEGVAFGPGKLSVALRRDSNDITQTSTAVTNNHGRSGTSLDMRLAKIAANPGGELEFGIDLRKSDQKDARPVPVETEATVAALIDRLASSFEALDED